MLLFPTRNEPHSCPFSTKALSQDVGSWGDVLGLSLGVEKGWGEKSWVEVGMLAPSLTSYLFPYLHNGIRMPALPTSQGCCDNKMTGLESEGSDTFNRLRQRGEGLFKNNDEDQG